jgi:hypothetical protein
VNELKKLRWRRIASGLMYSFFCLFFLVLAKGAERKGFVRIGPGGAGTMDASACHAVAVISLAGAIYCFVQAFRTKSN